jgi:hypothetical protein
MVDSVAFKEHLLEKYPEALGERWKVQDYMRQPIGKVEWIIVKAICDWGDGNKQKNTKLCRSGCCLSCRTRTS